MKKNVEFLKSDSLDDDTSFMIIALILVLIVCAVMISMEVYNIPKMLPTESEAREKILAQFPDCENELEAITETKIWAYPNYGGHVNTFNYLICESHEVKIEYFLPMH